MPVVLVRSLLAVLPLALMLSVSTARADDPTFNLTIRDHKFQPDMLEVPANTRIRLIVENTDATPEEFESHKLNREKVIPGNSKATILIGPLDPGSYPFVGEFHEDTAQGTIVAK